MVDATYIEPVMYQIIRYIRQELSEHYSPSETSLLARIILEEVSGFTFAALTSGKFSNLSDCQERKLQQILSRLKLGEPFQYVMGKTTFYGIELQVGREVLIPRPETEELVEWIIADCGAGATDILDIGTGSGCIAIALAVNMPQAQVHDWDLSLPALQMAQGNARLNHVEVLFRQRDILKPFTEESRYDCIVSNPPYITLSEKTTMERTVTAFEPGEALFVPDKSPLLFYERIASLAVDLLKEEGRLFFEIHQSRGDEVCAMLLEKGFREIELRKDLSGNERMIRAVKGDQR